MHGLEDVSKWSSRNWSMQAAVSRTCLIVLLCRPLELGTPSLLMLLMPLTRRSKVIAEGSLWCMCSVDGKCKGRN